MGDIGNAISGALNTVEHIGSAVGDLASGNISGALGDVGKAATSGIGAAVNGFMAANPEMGAIGKLGGGLSSLLGAAGGAGGAGGLGQAGGNPSPFGLGNLLPGILQNPLGSLFGGGGSGGGGGIGGLLGGGGGASGGGPDFSGIGQGVSQGGGGVTGGGGNDPNGELGQLKNIDAGAEAFQLALSMEQVRHQESMAALKAMGSAFQ